MYELKSSSGLPLPVVKSVKLSFTNTPCKTEGLLRYVFISRIINLNINKDIRRNFVYLINLTYEYILYI